MFAPTAGEGFEILTADGGLGGTEFITQPIDLSTLTGYLAWDMAYGSGFIRLDVLTPFTADFDGDGDAYDLGKGQGDDGGPGSDGDGDSDGADVPAWQQQNGSGVTPLAISGGIPEPSALVILLTTTCAGLPVRRRSSD